MVARSLHRMTANYLEDKYFLDSSVVSQLMRSRKSTRRLLGWTMRLVSHTVLDTVFLSVTTSLLSVALDCSLHPSTTGLGNRALRTMLPLRWSVGGTLRALSCGAAAVGTQYLLSPIVTSLVDRGLVTVFVSSEYFLLRRYRTFPPDSDEESEEDDEELANEPHTDMESVAGDEDAAKKAEREYRRQRRQKRKLREAKQKAREDALRAAIYRNILYRVIATLVADVLAAHPLRVLTEVFRGRAMLHLTGMPFYYDKVQPGTAITKDDVVAFFQFETEDDVPPVVEGMRSAVKSLAVESEAVVAALQNNKNGLALTPQNFVGDSREKMKIVAYTLLPLFNGVQYTALDCLLGFYLSVWTRLYK
ncbi:hypothetical protein AGDE_08742 [Angomonas deanei]|uniref:Uncharacterized protein n=1 Tax=Angomonas deanei TaxID=59799 RepID=A0A7G2C985_9TRYP|nr:hypothetical protein AGDE_08742 [Angomonas deanei]CAD2214572.1 hypothetical protein, conserved [Angomonas deanei]|eukprot:EPY32339.1 hypothetical protein AGDE_08742 [Angomonas deanei]